MQLFAVLPHKIMKMNDKIQKEMINRYGKDQVLGGIEKFYFIGNQEGNQKWMVMILLIALFGVSIYVTHSKEAKFSAINRFERVESR